MEFAEENGLYQDVTRRESRESERDALKCFVVRFGLNLIDTIQHMRNDYSLHRRAVMLTLYLASQPAYADPRIE